MNYENLFESPESAIARYTTPKTILTDFDEVLVITSPRVVRRMKNNIEYFGQYLNLDKSLSTKEVMDRKDYYLEYFLKKDGIELPEDIHKYVHEIWNMEDIYENLSPTKMCLALKEFSESDKCKNLYITTHCVGDVQIKAKTKFLSKIFGNNPKVSFLAIDCNTNKSKVINENVPDWDVFIDDSLTVVKDVVSNTNSVGNEIYIPKYGYNQKDENLKELIKLLNLQVYYYFEV